MKEDDFKAIVEAIEKANWLKIGFKIGFGWFLFSLLVGFILIFLWSILLF